MVQSLKTKLYHGQKNSHYMCSHQPMIPHCNSRHIHCRDISKKSWISLLSLYTGRSIGKGHSEYRICFRFTIA